MLQGCRVWCARGARLVDWIPPVRRFGLNRGMTDRGSGMTDRDRGMTVGGCGMTDSGNKMQTGLENAFIDDLQEVLAIAAPDQGFGERA